MFLLRSKNASHNHLGKVGLALVPISLLVALSSCNLFVNSPASSSSTSSGSSTVAVPAISPAGGSFTSAQTVTITDSTSGATIYYTTNGTTPTTGSTIYTSPFAVAANGTTTIEAIAAKSGMTTSTAESVNFLINATAVGTPVLSVGTGFYTSDQSVTITDPTPNAVIYYTTDGSSPVTSSTAAQYTGTPVSVSGAGTTTTITAYAKESGLTSSATTSATYTMSLFNAAQDLFQSSTVTHIAAGDLNGDGKTDIVGVESTGALQVYLQSGGALQSPVSYSAPSGVSTAPTSIAVGDLNGDGLNDIAVGYGSSNLIAIYYQQSSTHTFGTPTTISTSDAYTVRIGDVTGDGKADLVGLEWPASTSAMTNDLSVWAQSGGSLASTPAEYTVQEGGYPQMAIADVSNDSLNDVVVMSGQTYSVPQLSVLTQSSGHTLNSPSTYSLPVSSTNATGMAVGDVNGDGLNDVVLSYGGNTSPSLALFLQNGSGGLTAPTSSLTAKEFPTGLAVLDVNGDGRDDIVAVNGYSYGLDVYLQQSGGGFTHEGYYSGGNNFGSLVTGDFNGDGKVDLAGSTTNGGIVLFTHR